MPPPKQCDHSPTELVLQVLEYTRFQPGGFMDYLGHPHRVTKHAETLGLHINIEKCEAVLVEGSLDDEMTFTSINDIANVVVRAVEFEGDWPPVGGISGTRITQGELLRLAEKVRGMFRFAFLDSAFLFCLLESFSNISM